MCESCNQQALVALEAIANGEEIPPPPAAPQTEDVVLAPYCLPFPVMITITENGAVGIITNQQGGDAIRCYLESLGTPEDECGHDHHS
ncbi:hypothetical protein [Streptomyces sp. NPDC010273]|uniref:hypothetical protein n=1 Tax=Streptomyces sp. NPDC010273 TaxID=3364829 RepID=UPI0036F0A573